GFGIFAGAGLALRGLACAAELHRQLANASFILQHLALKTAHSKTPHSTHSPNRPLGCEEIPGKEPSALKGTFAEPALQAEMRVCRPFPGLRPGLTETALQAERNSAVCHRL